MIVDVTDLNIIRARGETMTAPYSSATNYTVRKKRRKHILVFPGNEKSEHTGYVVT